MDLKASIHSSQVESLSELKVYGNVDIPETISDNKNSFFCDKAIQVGGTPDFNENCSATRFSGIGEEISLMSETAFSRANSLKYEGDYYSLEALFTSDEYSDMSSEYILQSVVPIIEKFDVHYIWNIFKNVIENRTTSLPEENSLSGIEWLKEPTFRLAKILYYFSKKMQFMQSEPLQSIITVDKWSDVLVSELMKGLPLKFPEKVQGEIKEKNINRQDLNKLLCKTDDLQHQILCLRSENAQVQDMLADAGKNLEIANEENFLLKNQLYRAKVNLNEIDNLTSEIWSLKAKLAKYECSDRRKRRRLQEIEEQKSVLFARVHDVEEKIQRWHSIVEDAKNEINSLKYLIRVQEKRVISAIQERTLTEFHINELTQTNSDLESSVNELIGANDALRSDQHTLKKQLDEMQCLMIRGEDGCQNNNTFECMYSILCEDSKASEKEVSSSSAHTMAANERVNADLQKSIEIKSGSSSLQKSLGSDDNAKGFLDEEIDLQKKNSASGKSVICHTSDVRDQINEEIRALREQLVRSQVLFTYLLKDGSTDHTPKGLDCKTHLRTLLEEGNLSDIIFQCKSFDGQVPARFYNRSNRSSSSYASHRSTPMHCGYTSQSCPTLPIESPVVTKATQTEPMTGDAFYMRTGTNGVLSATSSNSLNKGNVFFSPPSTPCDNICEPLVITDVCEVHREPDNHSFPRHRTNSFLSAVKDGNPKLIDATESNARSSEFDDSITYIERKRSKKFNFIDSCIETEYFEQSSKAIDSELRGVIEDNKECTFPRKLSILLEEDYEDASGNYFSVCSSQPFLNRKKKLSPSCNVKTQTELSISSQSPCIQNQTSSKKTVSDDLPVKEFCLPRHGYSIITAAIQKKTVYSEELPHKLVLRHPPPYTKHQSKSSGCMSSGTSYFQECHSKPKTHIYKWATVAESLPSKSEFSHNLTPKTRNDSSLQTRHLSLEKQESFSSCDHSLYPDSQMSSITDCSGWMTKSDIELNARPEPPSYQQTIIASHRHQSTRNRSEIVASGKKPSIDQHGNSTTMKSGSIKLESDIRATDERNENNKEKNCKISQRSMRRGSGAGSPNSQLSIPRYPAFDFGEQEDAQSLFPSPSETEANRNIKAEILQGMKNSELGSEGDSNQISSKSSKETSQKKRDTNKSKSLMPELMENSETESAKGSFECEAPDLPPSVDAPPVPMIDIAFPSLPNTFLAKLGVHKDSPLSVEAFDEQELESKFIALSLAFKTDRTTLSKRLELHKRHRDMAEKNVENEFQAMREHLNALNLKATRADVRELISKIQNHLDIAQQATSRVSGRSETYGAVQQEERVSRAFEVLVLHVDHLKRLFDKEHKELEETRRMLTDTQAFRKDVVGESVTEDQKKYLRAFGLPVGAIKSVFSLSSLLSIFRLSFKVGRRRASVAEFHQSSVQETRRPPGFNQSWTSGYGARKVEPRQHTLCPFPTASSVGLSSSSLPTSQVTSISPSRISTVSISARRCSLPAASPLVPNMLQNIEAAPKNLNLTVQSLPSDKQKKKERNLWTRKLSSVRDEQDEDECEDEKGVFPNQSPFEVTKHLATSNKTLDSEAYFQQFDADDESEEMSESEENNMSERESTIFQIFRISSVKDMFNQGMQKFHEIMLQYYPGEIDVRNIWTFYPFIIIIILLCIRIFFYFSMESISSLFVSI